MAFSFLDRCWFVAGSSGTADFSDGSALAGYRSLANAGAINTAIYCYAAESADKSQWEIGYGAYTSGGGTLARNTVIASSTGSKVNFSAAPRVMITTLKAALDDFMAEAKREILEYALSDEATALSASGNPKLTVRAPWAFTLNAVRASLSTAGTGLTTIDINKNGTTVLSTKLTIDSTEKTSVIAAAVAVISVSAFADDDEITFDFDGVGSGAKGAKVRLYVTRA
jgi:hypothetical protein